MSYFNELAATEKAKLTIENVSIRTYYEDGKIAFGIKNPGLDFSKIIWKIENAVFANDCSFSGEFECALEFKNCYFLNDVIFYDCTFSKRLAIAHSFCEREMRIDKGAVFSDDFDLIVLGIQNQLYVDGGEFTKCKWSIVDNGTVKISGGHFESLNLGYWGGVQLKELSFHFPTIKGLIKVTNDKSKIESLHLFQFSSELAMAIEDVSVNLLSITDLEMNNHSGYLM